MSFPILGTVQLGMPYGVANRTGQPDRALAFAILETAVREGITSFDTAAAYGTSEEILGEFIAAHGLHSLKVISKVAPGEPVDATLQRLGLQLDVLLLHRFDPNASMDQYRGAARLLGMSVYEPDEALAVLRDLDAVQLPLWSAAALPPLADAREARKRIDVRSIFLQGLIALPTPPPHLAGIAPFLQTLDQLGDRLELCVTFARDLDGVDGVLFGAETPEQVREFAQRWKAPAMSAETRETILQAIQAVPADVLDPRKWNGRIASHASS